MKYYFRFCGIWIRIPKKLFYHSFINRWFYTMMKGE